jgi:hypothetical protein
MLLHVGTMLATVVRRKSMDLVLAKAPYTTAGQSRDHAAVRATSRRRPR